MVVVTVVGIGAIFLNIFPMRVGDCYALNWYNHYKSMSLPLNQFINRSLADVTEK